MNFHLTCAPNALRGAATHRFQKRGRHAQRFGDPDIGRAAHLFRFLPCLTSLRASACNETPGVEEHGALLAPGKLRTRPRLCGARDYPSRRGSAPRPDNGYRLDRACNRQSRARFGDPSLSHADRICVRRETRTDWPCHCADIRNHTSQADLAWLGSARVFHQSIVSDFVEADHRAPWTVSTYLCAGGKKRLGPFRSKIWRGDQAPSGFHRKRT